MTKIVRFPNRYADKRGKTMWPLVMEFAQTCWMIGAWTQPQKQKGAATFCRFPAVLFSKALSRLNGCVEPIEQFSKRTSGCVGLCTARAGQELHIPVEP